MVYPPAQAQQWQKAQKACDHRAFTLIRAVLGDKPPYGRLNCKALAHENCLYHRGPAL